MSPDALRCCSYVNTVAPTHTPHIEYYTMYLVQYTYNSIAINPCESLIHPDYANEH